MAEKIKHPPRLGRQTDLATELKITPSAVSQLIRRHQVPRDINGLIDLDYAIFLIRTRGEQKKQAALRARPKPAPRPDEWQKREFLSNLAGLWQKMYEQVSDQYNDIENATDIHGILVAAWQVFHKLADDNVFNQKDLTRKNWPEPPFVTQYLTELETQLDRIFTPFKTSEEDHEIIDKR